MQQTASQTQEPPSTRHELERERRKERSKNGPLPQGALAERASPRHCIACLRSEAQCACAHANY